MKQAKALISESSSSDTLRRADLARDRKAWGEAAELYARAASGLHMATGVHVQWGHCLKEAGFFDEAERQYRFYFDAHPEDTDILLQLGHLQVRQGNFLAARSFYEQALEAGGRALKRAGAVEVKSTGIERTILEIRRSLSLVMADLGELDEAQALLMTLVFEEGQIDLCGKLLFLGEKARRAAVAEIVYAKAVKRGDMSCYAVQAAIIMAEIATQEQRAAQAVSWLIKARAALRAESAWMLELPFVEGKLRKAKAQILPFTE